MVIVGIDPGSRRIGYGVVRIERKTPRFMGAGLLKIPRSVNDREALLYIKRGADRLMKQFRPQVVGIETIFFAKNKKTAIRVAHARGVLVLAALEYGAEIVELAPNEVKSSTTGYGRADKRGMAKMVAAILKEGDLRLIDDAVDALAVALTAGAHVEKRG